MISIQQAKEVNKLANDLENLNKRLKSMPTDTRTTYSVDLRNGYCVRIKSSAVLTDLREQRDEIKKELISLGVDIGCR